jgi:hypothetical protein
MMYSVQGRAKGKKTGGYPVGTGGSFPGGKVAGCVKLTTNLHVVLRSRMMKLCLLHTSTWSGA